MPGRTAHVLLRHLHTLTNGADVQADDAELLQRFIAGCDEAAFAALVRRHGPMVLQVARRVLFCADDAEDVFQATFLALASRPGSIRKGASLGCWLHGVAHRLALKARARATREQRAPAASAGTTGIDPAADLSVRELFALLDEELQRLPEKYRAPLLLCYLEERTHDEAARQLGCPLPTLRSRLQRARALLSARLSRRGVTLPATLLTAALTQASAAGAVPPTLLGVTVRAALAAEAAQVVPLRVLELARAVGTPSLTTRVRAVLLLLLFSIVAAGTGWSAYQGKAPAPPAAGLLNHALDPGFQDLPPKAPLGDQRAEEVDPDSDGDGLSDFHEIHKYRTDPNKKDTVGKGVSDGDWQPRREFTYSVRAVLRVMPPYNLKALTDDYQDVRVRKETKEYVELEVVAYPFNTNADAIKGNANWKKDYAGMKAYLSPGITTNWDDAMRKDLLRELAKDGIDPDKLTDKEVVEQVSRWLFKRSKHRNMFCTFYVGFRDGKPEVLPGAEKAFERDKGDPKWGVQEQFEHELFGKEMFARRTYGTCTSTAVYQTTVLRALGIPTRIILCIPLADGSDMAQVEMVDKGLTNHRVRCDACLGALSGGGGFASHTFCEVFVGGRWRRLNYTKLGQDIVERNYLGLMIKVHTFNDLSEANLAATWGVRYAKGLRDDVFKHSNPYRLLEVSDRFGKYGTVPNLPSDKELEQVTITKVYWPDQHAPAEVQKLEQQRVLEEWKLIEMGFGPQSRRFYVHCQEWLDDAGDYLQYKMFMMRADRNFVLRAKDHADVSCQISTSYYTHRSRNLCELEVVLPLAEDAKMAQGVAYTLHPLNGKKGYEWKVGEGVKLTRE